jgi:hypothetical protein
VHTKSICTLLILLAIALNLAATAASQTIPPRPLPPPGSVSNADAVPEDENRARIEADMAKRANQERQAQLKRDTDKLLKLANELKAYVDKSNEHVLSLDVVKKADEIEKLARSVKDKMKGPN